MTNSFQPAEDIFDDVEGHMPRIKLPVEAEETDEVEGHGTLRGGIVNDDDDNVEGHGVRVKI